MNEVVIDDSQREMCAVLVMRTMLTDYCDDTGVSFNDVFFRLPSISIFFVTAIIVILHKFHVKLAEPKPCRISCFLLCRVNADQCITAAHSRQLSIPFLNLLVIDQRIGQALT